MKVLEAIKRKNISPEKYSKMVDVGRQYGVNTYTEFILPLPLETLDTFCDGMSACLEQGQHTSIDVWPAGLLPKSEMAQPEYREKYGLKWVEAEDFAKNNLLVLDYDDENTVEKTLVVVETNTMPMADVLKSYLFAWTLVRMHFCGYSQIVSRYLNTKHGVPYLDFYRKFQDAFAAHPEFSYAYNEIYKYVDTFLKTGNYSDTLDASLKPKMGHHFVIGLARGWCYERKDMLIDLAIQVASEFAQIPDVYQDMQRVFVYDANTEYPVKFSDDFDIVTALSGEVHYQISDILNDYKKQDDMVDDGSGMVKRRQGYRCYITTDSPTFQTINVVERVSEALEKAEQKLIAKG
jgi:hypothetical protein